MVGSVVPLLRDYFHVEKANVDNILGVNYNIYAWFCASPVHQILFLGLS
jgi:hypothetical protein